MAFITANYKENSSNDFEALPTGNYEVIIQSAQEKATPKGAESLQLRLVVRNDLDGVPEFDKTNAKYHNRIVFMDNWKRKATGQYDTKSLQYILEACEIPEGTPLDSIADFSKALAGRPANVYVKKSVDSYNGENREINQVAPWNFKKSKFPQVNHKFKDGELGIDPFADSKQVDIQDSDLPF